MPPWSVVLESEGLRNPSGALLPLSHSPLLSAQCMLCCPVHRALWEKTLLQQQQQQDNKGHVNERTGRGRGKGDFGSNTPSSRASLLPSSPSSLNQMGGSHRDHPAPRGTTSLLRGAQMTSLYGIFVASPLLPDRHFTFSWAQRLFPWPTLTLPHLLPGHFWLLMDHLWLFAMIWAHVERLWSSQGLEHPYGGTSALLPQSLDGVCSNGLSLCSL